MSALKGMFSFFTMVRLDISQEDMDDMDRKFYLVPVVGIFYGLVAAALLLVLRELIPIFPAAVLTMFIIHGLNRFLHLDGAMDVGDGLVVSGGVEDHVRALKDTRIGAGGVAFALFLVVLTIAAISGFWAGYMIIAPFLAEVLAKNSMVSAAAFGRPGGGMAGNSVRNTDSRQVVISSLISAAAVVLFSLIASAAWTSVDIGVMLMVTVVTIIASVITGAVMARVAERNFGMVNGDVLGATNEVSRAVSLLLMLALVSVI